ncbi:GAD-like domain-containing protein [Massilia luteola]|uniref:GAD-like domain-containing protein n=1 Tax=Massilia luteola TaxID=3081751 RepID=UPI002ACC1AE8|nr:GAD-like domain-containing protein [Massilia sp. Gc5]
MRDEDFEVFIDEFGEATHRFEVPASSIEKWRDKLPDQLLTYWKNEGWCGYANGLFWTVDPDEYEDLIDEWLEDTKLEEIDSFHVIARSAFGDLYACGENTGRSVTIACPLNNIIAFKNKLKPKPKDDLDLSIRAFFSLSEPKDFDLKDENSQPLFKRASEKLGQLAPDEMYGFEPALVLGGKIRLENLFKVKTDVHLTILRQLASPALPFSNVDIDNLLNP